MEAGGPCLGLGLGAGSLGAGRLGAGRLVLRLSLSRAWAWAARVRRAWALPDVSGLGWLGAGAVRGTGAE